MASVFRCECPGPSQRNKIEANQRRVAPPSPMRDGMINKARMLPNAISHVAVEQVVPFFHSITKLKIFITGSAKAGT
jgi:hypothetical protein